MGDAVVRRRGLLLLPERDTADGSADGERLEVGQDKSKKKKKKKKVLVSLQGVKKHLKQPTDCSN